MSKIQKLHWSNWLAIGIAVCSLFVALYTAWINREADIMTKENLAVSKKAMESSDEATKQTLHNLSSLRVAFKETKNEMANLPPAIKELNNSFGTLKKAANSQISEYSKRPWLMPAILDFNREINDVHAKVGIANFGDKEGQDITCTFILPKDIALTSYNGVDFSEDVSFSKGEMFTFSYDKIQISPNKNSEDYPFISRQSRTIDLTLADNKTNPIKINYTIRANNFYDKGYLSIDINTHKVYVCQEDWTQIVDSQKGFNGKLNGYKFIKKEIR